jgi:glycosyltransferase involved in cell wall biosynthesis
MLSHGYPPTISGVTLVVQKISRAMVERGHEVMVLTASERNLPYESEDQGVKLVRTFGFPNVFWPEGPVPITTPWAIRKLADEFKPDIIHTHENAILSLMLVRTNWKVRPKLITSSYSLPRYATNYLHFGGLDTRFESFLWGYVVRHLGRYEHVVFCTHTHEHDFIAHGLKPPTTVISNGVNILRYCPEKEPGENIEARYQLPLHPRILSVGRLMKDKKLDLLIKAMRVVCDQREAHLIVVGRGSERPRLKSMIHKLRLDAYIHLLGYVPESDLPGLYRASDMFAIPSLVEVQSIPAIQAAVSALPIVAANSAALPELVRDGENGFLVDPLDAQELGQAILTIIKDPELAKKMGRVSLEIGCAHDERLTFQAYEDFYRSLVDEAYEQVSIRGQLVSEGTSERTGIES